MVDLPTTEIIEPLFLEEGGSIMSVITPAPQPKNDFYKIIEQTEKKLNQEDNKPLMDTNKKYKNVKEKSKKTEQH